MSSSAILNRSAKLAAAVPVLEGLGTGTDLQSAEVARRQEEGLSNNILRSLSAPELKRLLPYLEPVALRRGEDVTNSKGFDDYIYFPESAVLAHVYRLNDGTTTGAAVIGNDGVIGLSKIFGSHTPAYRATVLVEGGGLKIKAQVAGQEFARGENFQQLILNHMSNRLIQLSQRAVCNGRHKLTERLCTWLLMIDDRTTEGSLPLTHAEIADHLGARRTVISGYCHGFRERKMITYNRGRLVVLDRAILEDEACECYHVMKTQ